MNLLLAWFTRRGAPPDEAARVIRAFVTTLDRLGRLDRFDGVTTGRLPPERTR